MTPSMSTVLPFRRPAKKLAAQPDPAPEPAKHKPIHCPGCGWVLPSTLHLIGWRVRGTVSVQVECPDCGATLLAPVVFK